MVPGSQPHCTRAWGAHSSCVGGTAGDAPAPGTAANGSGADLAGGPTLGRETTRPAGWGVALRRVWCRLCGCRRFAFTGGPTLRGRAGEGRVGAGWCPCPTPWGCSSAVERSPCTREARSSRLLISTQHDGLRTLRPSLQFLSPACSLHGTCHPGHRSGCARTRPVILRREARRAPPQHRSGRARRPAPCGGGSSDRRLGQYHASHGARAFARGSGPKHRCARASPVESGPDGAHHNQEDDGPVASLSGSGCRRTGPQRRLPERWRPGGGGSAAWRVAASQRAHFA